MGTLLITFNFSSGFRISRYRKIPGYELEVPDLLFFTIIFINELINLVKLVWFPQECALFQAHLLRRIRFASCFRILSNLEGL